MTNEQLLKRVGRRVHELRKARNLRQEEMCQFGFEYKYYQRIECGQKNVTLKTLNRLAKALQVPVAELFNFDEE